MAKKTDDVQDGTGKPRGREFYVDMAKHPRSRVIMANASDTFMIADIARQSDLIISRLRDSLMRSVPVDEFSQEMDEYYKRVFALEDHLARMGEKVGIKYRKSRTYMDALKKNAETPEELETSP